MDSTCPALVLIALQSFITWLAALTNSAIVFLFQPSSSSGGLFYSIFHNAIEDKTKSGPLKTLETSIVPALLIALSASHGYLVMQMVTRHVLERMLWKGCKEAKEMDVKDRDVKESYLKGVMSSSATKVGGGKRSADMGELWHDDGRAELEQWIKTE